MEEEADGLPPPPIAAPPPPRRGAGLRRGAVTPLGGAPTRDGAQSPWAPAEATLPRLDDHRTAAGVPAPHRRALAALAGVLVVEIFRGAVTAALWSSTGVSRSTPAAGEEEEATPPRRSRPMGKAVILRTEEEGKEAGARTGRPRRLPRAMRTPRCSTARALAVVRARALVLAAATKEGQQGQEGQREELLTLLLRRPPPLATTRSPP